MFRYAISTLRAEIDPTYALRGALAAPNVTNRPAITDEEKFGDLLRRIDAYEGRWPSLKAALKFLVLTMARPCEVRFLRKSEVNFLKRTWTVPADRMKMRRPHDVPLSNQALDLLRSVWDENDGLIFPSPHSKTRPLSENAFNSALRRMGFEKHEVTSHGFRATASTILNERGFSPDVIEAALAHQDKNAIRRAYNRATYWSERVQMMQAWADMLDEFKKTVETGCVA